MENKIRILYVIDKLEVGGTEKQLVETIKRLDKEKFEVYLCCLSGAKSGIDKNFDGFDRVKTFTMDLKSVYSLNAGVAIWRLKKMIKSWRIDIVQVYFLKAKFLGIVAGKWANAETISSMRDLGLYIDFKSRFPIWIADRLARRFLVNSKSIKSYLVEKHGIPPDRITVILNGVDMVRFRSSTPTQKNEAKKRLGFDPGDPVVGIVANLKPVKGLSSFIRAAATVAVRFPRARFVIVGEGPDESILKKEAEELGIDGAVLFAGGSSDVLSILAGFDIGVLCSLSEGFSNSILEYMAVGIPVVATRTGGNTEQVLDGRTGYLVPPDEPRALSEAVSKLIENEGLRNEIGGEARRYCEEHFSMDGMIRKTEEFYESILSGRSGGNTITAKTSIVG